MKDAMWNWFVARPGVLALSGTPFQVRRENLLNANGEVAARHVWLIYEHDNMVSLAATLAGAKYEAQKRCRELIECGIVEDPRE